MSEESTEQSTEQATGPGSDEMFTWKCKSGDLIKLPSLAELDPDVGTAERLAKSRADDDNDIVQMGHHIAFLASGLGEQYAALLRKVRVSEFQAFMQAWGKHSGVSAGESQAS